ncbi:MAG: hypothetical protein AAGH79_01385 [Bacteroidota bacterium]
MAFALLLISTFILYAKSKYFPARLKDRMAILRQHPRAFRLVAYALSGLAMWLMIGQYDGFTGFLVWSYALMLSFGLLVIGLPLLYKS